jgi:hypothetical protein
MVHVFYWLELFFFNHYCLWMFVFIMLFNFNPFAYITNLTSHNLIMETMQILFIHNSYVHALILCIENTFDIQIYTKMQNLCDITHS